MKPVYSLLVALPLVLTTAPACAMQESDQAAEEGTAEPAEGSAEAEDNTLYALGLALAQGLAQFNLTEEELDTVQEGIADGVLGHDPRVNVQEYMMQIQQLAQARAQAVADAERAAGGDFLAQAAAEEGAVKTESGMVYQILEEGTGESPEATDTVQVHYRGTLRDGEVFDSSYERGQPATFGLNQVIACWTEGLQHMKEGGKAKLVCPPDLAYGDRAQGPIPAGSTLVFEVELLDVVEQEAPAEPPAAEPPAEEPPSEPPPAGG